MPEYKADRKVLFILIFLLGLVLRFYQLGKVPLSIYWDEASLGYNAYSISQTTRDEFGAFLPLDKFIAFGDYKPPLYIYSVVPFVKLLGLNELAVRLPSAIAGSFLILAACFLCLELFKQDLRKSKIALLASLTVAVSPWSLQLSRAGFEANFAATLSAFGLLFLLKLLSSQKLRYLILAVIFLVAPMYTFNSQRIFIPLIIAAVIIIRFKQSLANWKEIIILGMVALILLLPALPHLLSREASLRFAEVAWVNDIAPITLSNSRIATDQENLVAKIIHNRRLVYAGQFLAHFSDHFRPDYLFFSGDPNPKLSDQNVGEFYWFDLLPLLVGFIFLLRNHPKAGIFLFSWWLLGIVPAALARETPHALRTVNILPVPQIVIAVGLAAISSWFSFQRKSFYSFSAGLAVFLTITLFSSLYYYYQIYPAKSALDWQYGYKQMVQYVLPVKDQYRGVMVTETYGRPYIYFLFYGHIDPQEYWSTVNRTRDWFGLWTVHSFNNIHFGEGQADQPGWLYVRPPDHALPGGQLISTINGPDGSEIFEISQK